MTSWRSARSCCSARSSTPTPRSIGERLAAHGIASRLQVKVGDNVERIEKVFRQMLAEADALIVCGGLGPTHDDVTREAIAAVMGVELELDEEVADVIRDLFSQLRRPMSENNLRQAMVPVGATVIPQRRGTAPGLICPFRLDGVDRVVYAVPGVPDEMEEMLERAVLPDLLARAGEPTVIASRVLKVWGESESGLNARLDDVIARLDEDGDVTLAFLARGWNGLEIRLTTSAESAAAAQDKLRPWETEIRALLGKVVFGSRRGLDGVGRARRPASAGMRRWGSPSRSRPGSWPPGWGAFPEPATCCAARSSRMPATSSSISSASPRVR